MLMHEKDMSDPYAKCINKHIFSKPWSNGHIASYKSSKQVVICSSSIT